jgi:HlyD family secretion protein
MKRPPLRTLLIAATASVAVLLLSLEWWGVPALHALGLGGEPARYLGYVEGETSLIGPPVAGRLLERPVNRGDQIKKGQQLFVIDPVLAKAEVARTEAALAEARSRLANLLTGKRQEEQDVVRAQRRENDAALAMAETEYKRQSDLLARGVSSRRDYDQAESNLRQLRSRAASLAAQEKVGDLAARPDEIEAARAQVEQGQANLEQARKKLEDQMPSAPEDALVENTFFNIGEWVPAGSPVVSLLPPFRVKLRFYVPEEEIVRARMGEEVSFSCDSCPKDLKANIIYVSPRAEYTPPVIYSQTARTKLVFLVEARPQPTKTPLPPGLPITVAPLPAAAPPLISNR